MDDVAMIYRTFKFRCYPGAQVRAKATWVMARVMKPIWNETRWHLEHNRRAVAGVLAVNARLPKSRQVPVPQRIGNRGPYELITTRLHPEYAGTSSAAREMMQTILHASYQSYWSLLKNGHTDARPPGAMKFCGFVSYRKSGWKLDGRTVELLGIGRIPIRMHRDLLGKIKTVTLRVKNDKWHVCFSCEITDFPGVCRPLSQAKALTGKGLGQKHLSSGGLDPQGGGTDNSRRSLRAVWHGGLDPQSGGTDNTDKRRLAVSAGGLDPQSGGTDNARLKRVQRPIGGPDLRSGGTDNDCRMIVAVWLDVDGQFLCDSDGRKVPVPGFYEAALPVGQRLGQALTRKVKGSKNRRKARRRLANFHEHLANQRSAFLWNEALHYAKDYDGVILFTRPAKPPIQYARNERTARVLCDGAYALFAERLKQKCEWYGTQIIIKEKPTWQNEQRQLKAQELVEQAQRILWQWRRSSRKNNPAFMAFLARASERLATWDAA